MILKVTGTYRVVSQVDTDSVAFKRFVAQNPYYKIMMTDTGQQRTVATLFARSLFGGKPVSVVADSMDWTAEGVK